MCGRYTITHDLNKIEEFFKAIFKDKSFKPRFNIAPTQKSLVITNKEPDKIDLLQWGLIPSWAKDAKLASKMINARSETITEKPSFKNAFKSRRCLIVADSYYEWKNEGKEKIPYRITLNDESLFAFAGIWETWKNELNEELKTFSIITVNSNDFLSNIHERMPVIIEPNNYANWLNNKTKEEDLKALLKAQPSKKFKLYQVSKKVNSVFNDSDQLILNFI